MIISENHDTLIGGHFGARKTQDLIERSWYWDGLARDVRDYVRSCLTCQEQKHVTHKEPGLRYPILASRPWQIVTMDYVCGLPVVGKLKYSQVLVMVDKFSKYVTLEPCPEEMNAAATAEVFIRRVIANFGVPEVIISDRGPQFASNLWKEILQSLGSRVALASPHHPQTDGQSERAIQTLLG